MTSELNGKQTSSGTRWIQVSLLIAAIGCAVFGLSLDGPHLLLLLSDLSPDGTINHAPTVELIRNFPRKVLTLGVVLLVLTLLLAPLLRIFAKVLTATRNPDTQQLAALGKWGNKILRVALRPKLLLTVGLFIFFTLQILSVYYQPMGFHSYGIRLQPAKNLARHGIYATMSTDGFDRQTHRITTGPSCLVPVALAFKLFGINVTVAHWTQLLFNLGALIAFYITANQLFGRRGGILALLLLSTSEFMGESIGGNPYTTAFFYGLIGTLLWSRGITSGRRTSLVLAGVFWGLSFQSQWLFLFLILAAAVTAILAGLPKRVVIIPALMILMVTALWVGIRASMVGIKGELLHLNRLFMQHSERAIGGGLEEDVSVFNMIRPLASLSRVDLWKELQIFLVLPGMIYPFLLCLRSRWKSHLHVFWLSMLVIWFTWWFLFNFDLPLEHLFLVRAIGVMYSAKFLLDVWDYANRGHGSLADIPSQRKVDIDFVRGSLKTFAVIVVLLSVLGGALQRAAFLLTARKDLVEPYNRFLQYVKANTEPNAVFSGWWWQIPWYLDFDSQRDRVCKDRLDVPPTHRESCPEYFIVSPEWPLEKRLEWPASYPDNAQTRYSNKIRKEFIENQCTLMDAFGDYHQWAIYRVNPLVSHPERQVSSLKANVRPAGH